MNKTKFSTLLGTASIAAFAYAGALSAQDQITDYADFGDTYENIIDVDYDEAYDVEINGYNELTSEGALGAINTGLDQVAVTQFVNVAAQTDSANDTLIDLSHYAYYDDSYGNRLDLGASNEATAHTTSFDALLGGSQVAVVSFNTAALDIDMVGEDDAADVALLQDFDGDYHDDEPGDYGYYIDLSAENMMDAAAAYAGTATIDSATWDDEANEGEGGYVNGVQQAAISVNTFRLDSEVDTTIEFAGQHLDTADIVSGYYDAYSDFTTRNTALAYSPTPATSEFVDPRLATDDNDPSVNNLDQIAAVTFNTMSMGNAADAEEGIEASTADFTIYNYDNSGGNESSAWGQDLYFDDVDDEIEIANVIAATTYYGQYEDLNGDISPMYEVDGRGDVSLNNVSQVAAMTMNSISNAGEGDLTLKDVSAYGEDYVMSNQGDFEQEVDNFDYDTGTENLAIANTDYGNATASGVDQIAQYSFNSISSGGDLNGWNDEGEGEGDVILQDINDTIFTISDGFDDGLNNLDVDSDEEGYALASDVSQVFQLSMDTVSVGGDLTARLVQAYEDDDDNEINVNDEINYIDMNSYEGDATVDIAEQVALATINSVSVDGTLTSEWVEQDAELDEFDVNENFNDVDLLAYYGNASVSGLDQIAQLTFNSLSANALDATVDQEIDDLDEMDNDYAINRMDAESDYEGDASIADSSQAFILNANAVRIDTSATGDLTQNTDYVDLDTDGPTNYAYAWADQDLGDARWAGGNASISGLTQTLSTSFNSISAGSLAGVTIDQYASDINVDMVNYAYADAEWGAASITGVSQQTINRINSISITPPSID